MKEQDNKVKQLEYQLFIMACIISASAALAIALLDLFITGHKISFALDMIGFLAFGTFYYLSKNENIYFKLVLPFIITLYLLINLSWFFQGGGFNMSDTIIFFLIFIVSLLIVPKKYRFILIGITSINILVLVILENMDASFRYVYSDRTEEIFVSDIFVILLFAIGGYVIFNFKRKYEILSDQLINANEHIIKSHKDLEVTIHERTVELKRLNKELDRLFYRSSHDFRRPLTTLMGINEVARLIKLENNSMELMNLMDKTVNDMDRMLKKFYNLYEINHFPEDNKEISLYSVVEEYARDLIQQGHSIKWSIELEKYEELNIRNALIKIILKNILENSVQYSKNGKADIKMNFYEDDGYLAFQISDNGIGIDDSFHTQIFEMYFRATEISQGNGLGLYVVKTAVEKLHGIIRVVSERGKQTIFKIRFPI